MNARQEWKQDYKNLSNEIRALKLSFKQANREFNIAQRAYCTSNVQAAEIKQAFIDTDKKFWKARCELNAAQSAANGMLFDLPRIKAEGHAIWLAKQSEKANG